MESKLMKEIWKDIENYSTYEISNKARVRRKYDKKLLTIRDVPKEKCLKVKMTNDNWHREEIHLGRLLYKTFVHEIDRIAVIRYKDGDYHNLDLDNLYVDDISWANMCGAKPIKCVETGVEYKSINRARKELHCSGTDLKKAIDSGREIKGFHFVYA